MQVEKANNIYKVSVKSASFYPMRNPDDFGDIELRVFLKLKIEDEQKWVSDGREETSLEQTITGSKNNLNYSAIFNSNRN